MPGDVVEAEVEANRVRRAVHGVERRLTPAQGHGVEPYPGEVGGEEPADVRVVVDDRNEAVARG